VYPGCGTPISVCLLAKDAYLAPLVDTPWPKRSVKLITSYSKHGPGLFVFDPTVGFLGIFTNDDLVKKLGLQVPQTFPQLLAVCQQAKAEGTVAMLLPANGSTILPALAGEIALTTVYARDARWASPLFTPNRAFTPSLGSAARISTAARNARSAPSSCAAGTPNTATTASPMNLSTRPPCSSTIPFIRAK
jgi:hypothetical protein